MITSSNGNIFRVTGPLCGEFTGPGEFPIQMPVMRSFDVFLSATEETLSKQPWGWWFKTPSWSLWRQCNETKCSTTRTIVSLVSYLRGRKTSPDNMWIASERKRLFWDKLRKRHPEFDWTRKIHISNDYSRSKTLSWLGQFFNTAFRIRKKVMTIISLSISA